MVLFKRALTVHNLPQDLRFNIANQYLQDNGSYYLAVAFLGRSDAIEFAQDIIAFVSECLGIPKDEIVKERRGIYKPKIIHVQRKIVQRIPHGVLDIDRVITVTLEEVIYEAIEDRKLSLKDSLNFRLCIICEIFQMCISPKKPLSRKLLLTITSPSHQFHKQHQELVQYFGNRGRELYEKVVEEHGVVSTDTYHEIDEWMKKQSKFNRSLIDFVRETALPLDIHLKTNLFTRIFKSQRFLELPEEDQANKIRELLILFEEKLLTLLENGYSLYMPGGKKITSVPPEVSLFSNIFSLILANKGIIYIPCELARLDKLTYLDIRNNPILLPLPKEVDELFVWLREIGALFADEHVLAYVDKIIATKQLLDINSAD